MLRASLLLVPCCAAQVGAERVWSARFLQFLVRPDGTVFGRYAPTTSPNGLEKFIKEMLDSRAK